MWFLKSRKEHRRWERQRQVEILTWVIRAGLITKTVLKQSLKGGRVHHMSIWGKCNPSKENSQCRKLGVAGVEWVRKRLKREKLKERMRTKKRLEGPCSPLQDFLFYTLCGMGATSGFWHI